MTPRTLTGRIVALIRSGECNTSADIADVLGISRRHANSLIWLAANSGRRIRRSGRRIPTGYGGRPLVVWEAA